MSNAKISVYNPEINNHIYKYSQIIKLNTSSKIKN